jgi:hypothetical protein
MMRLVCAFLLGFCVGGCTIALDQEVTRPAKACPPADHPIVNRLKGAI